MNHSEDHLGKITNGGLKGRASRAQNPSMALPVKVGKSNGGGKVIVFVYGRNKRHNVLSNSWLPPESKPCHVLCL